MKKIKKNGFTLVEVIAVVAIIGILTMMAVPNVMKVLSEKKEKLYVTTISEIERIAGVYVTENSSIYSTIENNGYADINIEILCSEKYISCPINDPRDSSEIKGYVRVTKENEDYIYKFTRN